MSGTSGDRQHGGSGLDGDVTGLEYRPPDSNPPGCSYCGRPFPNDNLLALHRGLEHGDELSETEQAAFEDAFETEQQEIRQFRLKALGALVLLYFGFLMLYAFV